MRQAVSKPSAALATAPTFYLTGRQPIRPGAIALATVVAGLAMSSVLFGLRHTGRAGMARGGNADAGAAGVSAGSSRPANDDDDDPNQVDTIVLGDPSEAPVPARKGDHVSPVHATIVVRLPRFGDQVGLIPDGAAGRLLYAWLAAFNRADAAGLERAVPARAGGAAVVWAEMQMRRETGGFSLLSAKEVAPGVLVFRLRDQTPGAGEVLGTLEVRAGSSPAAVGSFSLRSVGAGGGGSAVVGSG